MPEPVAAGSTSCGNDEHRWWHWWFPPPSRVYGYCPVSTDGVHELREVSGPGAAGVHQDYLECIHCGWFQ